VIIISQTHYGDHSKPNSNTHKRLAFKVFLCYYLQAIMKGGYGMPRVCAVSGKKALSGNKRSHSLRATRRKWNVNLQKVTLIVDGKPQKVRISTRALKTLKAQQAA
jgi:large subunit ribosomal protein L28